MEICTAVVSSVVEKILEYPIRIIGRHLGYLIYYRANQENLTNQVTELGKKKSSIKRRAHDAQRNNEELEECVTDWISKAERKIQEANGVMNDGGHENAKCACNGSFPNLLSRYKLSKQAKLMAKDIDLIEKQGKFEKISYRPLIQTSFKNKDFEAFESRTKTLKEIMEALKDPDFSMIGVYGMGGVGKTTLVKEVAHQAKEEKCFTAVVVVTVSQELNPKDIQQGIAEELGLTLEGEILSRRANQLRHRLRQEKKILIILDDIWCELNLSEVGICFEAGDQKGCKILLVSRDRDVLCNRMGVDVTKIIEVKVLSDREPQGLFNKFVGDKADNSDFKELANQVVGECGGLPIAIVTIACSLKNKDIRVWKDFLSRLKSSRGMEGKVYSSIKMSYDFLEKEEEKKLLLLCSLHGEDANVRVDDLMFYGIGLDLFQEVHAMEEARCRAHSLVDKLKAHCLLLDGYKGRVKMHDVIRDVMISIAKEDEHMHCLTKVADLEDCLHKDNFRECSKAIVLLGPDFNNQLLPRLECPKLQLLSAFNRRYSYGSLRTIPDNFFKEAQELRALSFDCEPLQSLPQSFCTLRHLRALRLRLGKKEDFALIGELRNLIVLDLSMSSFSQLPEHIGKLTRLRSLNLSGCESLTVIQPNVISSLVRLEELYMDEVDIDWEVKAPVGEGRNASLMEFKNLRNLTTLHLNVRDANVLPKDMFGENLQRYEIKIGSISKYQDFTGSRLLHLNFRESSQLYQYGIQKLMRNSEGMWLEEFHGVDSIVYVLDGFPQLKEFCLRNNDEVRYIVHSTEEIQPCSAFPNLETLNLENLRNLEKICYSNVTMESFGKLRRIYVRNCDKLKNLFSFSIARKFEEIEVSECRMMERLVYHGSEDAPISEKIEFPQLHSLNLKSLSNFIFFWSGLETTCGSSLSDSPQPFFGEKVVFPSLKVLQLSGMNFRELWSSISCMQNLSSLDVSGCPNLKCLLTVAMAGKIPRLETLKISGCPLLEELVVTNEHGEGRLEKILFPKLKSLELEDLPNLKRFCTGDCIEGPFFNEKVSFPILEDLRLKRMNLKILWADQLSITSFGMQNLKRLFIVDCDSLSHLFSLDVARSLLQLEELQLWFCKDMEEVLVTKEPIEEGTPQKISFPKLKNLVLWNLQNIRRFCAGCCIEFPSLTNMSIFGGNPAMRTFITDSCNGASGELMGSEARQPLFNGKVAFPKLEELSVRNLDSVNSLFSFAVAKSLVTLKRLEVFWCGLMEEIVQVNEQGEEGRLDKISFPKLQFIHFYRLSNLKRFYGGACIEVLCPNLEELTTSSSEMIKQMCDCQSSRAPPFCSLKVVDLKCFRNEPIGFSLKCIQRYQNLESLSLRGFFVDTTHHRQIMISSEEHERPLKRLQKLKLFQLSMLTHLYEDSEDSENSSLESLKFLHIQECVRLMCPLLSSTTSFQNLLALVVSKCSAMINLLASSTAKTLVHLRLMSITECKQMTKIIADEIVEDEIVFGKLEILELSDLPSLRSFHSAGNSVMRFPNLVMLVVSQCPEMRKFSSGTIDAPKLDSISEMEKDEYRWLWVNNESTLDYEMSMLPEPQEKLWEGDINKTLEKLWEKDDSLVMQRLFTET